MDVDGRYTNHEGSKMPSQEVLEDPTKLHSCLVTVNTIAFPPCTGQEPVMPPLMHSKAACSLDRLSTIQEAAKSATDDTTCRAFKLRASHRAPVGREQQSGLRGEMFFAAPSPSRSRLL
jgi:hypothetical protein